MKKYLTLILLIGSFLIESLLASENKVTVSGYLIDSSSGESLIGANIYVGKLNIGTTTNAYGFYSLSIPMADSIGIVFSYIGYKLQVKKLFIKKNLKLNIALNPKPIEMGEVVVTARKENENVERKQIRDRKSTRLNSSHTDISRMPSSA